MIIPELGGLAPRQYGYRCPSGYSYRNGDCYRNNWSHWGRWVLAAVVIVFFLSLFVIWSCISNRRRRRQGMNPRYGTGWMMPGANNPGAHQQQQPQYGGGWFGQNKFGHNNNQQQYQQPPPPQYTPAQGPVPAQYTGQTFNSNEGYYGHHNNNNNNNNNNDNNDIPLQQPTSSYYPRGGDNVYEPPTGPPPAKS